MTKEDSLQELICTQHIANTFKVDNEVLSEYLFYPVDFCYHCCILDKISTPTLIEASLFLLLILTLYLKGRREEVLWYGHDEEYLVYRERTKLFIPYVL